MYVVVRGAFTASTSDVPRSVCKEVAFVLSDKDESCINLHSGHMSRDIVERFGERVRRLREAKGLNQIDFSAKVGIENAYLSRLETGKVEPCLRNIELLAIALETPLSKLFKDL